MEDEAEPFNTDDIPSWVQKATGVLAFVVITCAVIFLCGFLFFLLVRFGLWAFGVL